MTRPARGDSVVFASMVVDIVLGAGSFVDERYPGGSKVSVEERS